MAQLSRRLAHNTPGSFFVDDTCIDCDTCRWMAPDTFVSRSGQSSVASQPSDKASRRRAEMALVACPTSSIGSSEPPDLSALQGCFPDMIEGPVYHCGYHSEKSFGATSYLVRGGDGLGNILIDSPRFTKPLIDEIESMGGIDFMFLTHRDDIADHQKFHDHFACPRVMHEGEGSRATDGMEIVITGGSPVELDCGAQVIPVPGHTAGSCCLLVEDRFLFTGDHLAWSETRGHLYGFRSVCWHDWGELVRSTEKLLAYDFEWVLPGHGRRHFFERDEMKRQLRIALDWMRET